MQSRESILMNIIHSFIFILRLTERSTEFTAASCFQLVSFIAITFTLNRVTWLCVKYGGGSYVYWTVHYLDNWIKRDQLDVIYFIISLFNAQHVSDVNTSILRSLRLIYRFISWVVLLWFDVCWCYVVVWLGYAGWSTASTCLRIPHHPYQITKWHQHTSNQSNTTHEITL